MQDRIESNEISIRPPPTAVWQFPALLECETIGAVKLAWYHCRCARVAAAALRSWLRAADPRSCDHRQSISRRGACFCPLSAQTSDGAWGVTVPCTTRDGEGGAQVTFQPAIPASATGRRRARVGLCNDHSSRRLRLAQRRVRPPPLRGNTGIAFAGRTGGRRLRRWLCDSAIYQAIRL